MIIPRVDKDLCISCATCINLCPDVFQFGDDGKSEVINQEGCNGCDCQEAADSCPADAIILEER